MFYLTLLNLNLFTAAIKKKYENANNKNIKERIGSFLATAMDNDGGRMNRTTTEPHPLLSDGNVVLLCYILVFFLFFICISWI